MAIGTRNVGDFCWINILTPDPENARAFFAKVLRWTFADMGGMGHRIQVRGRDIGGIFDIVSPRTPAGAKPTIGVMIKVHDADATVVKCKSLGGLAMPPFDVGSAGRMAVCFDPNGAEFDVWQPKSMQGFDVDSSLFGAPTWFESISKDVSRDSLFYRTLFGWTSTDMPMPGMTYTTFSQGGPPIAGMMAATPAMKDLKPHWGVYFAVDNTDETAKLAVLLGAKLIIPPQEIPGAGRFCYLCSPEGVYFYVITYKS